MKNEKIGLAIAGCAAVMVGSMLFMLKTQNDSSSTVPVRVVSVPEASQEMSESITTATITSAAAEKRTEPETASGSETAAAPETTTLPLCVNINTADAAELMRLDGIGEVTADKILEYRDANGGFNNTEELMLVDGIGEKTFAAIMDYVYVEDPIYPEPETEEPETELLTEQATEPVVTEAATAATEPPTTVPETTHVLTLEEVRPIDLNTATAEELMLLPHITEDIAESILELRRKIGGYSHPYELMYIDELEQNQVAEILEFVIVGQ